MGSTSLALVVHQGSNHDELFMNQTLRFSETLTDLKTLRKQLYSAADYFEESYGKEEEKHLVIETLKDYAMKAVVNTVDHLGSVSDKFNGFLNEKTDQMSGTDLRLHCLEQRLKACQEYIDQGGMHQQLLVIETPRHHKRYIFTDEDMQQNRLDNRCRSFNCGEDSQRFKSAVRAAVRDTQMRQGNSERQIQRFPSKLSNSSLSMMSKNRTPEKQVVSSLRQSVARSGSLLKRSISPSFSRKQATESKRSTLVPANSERRIVGMEQHFSKSKNMFKTLLSMRKSRKDGSM